MDDLIELLEDRKNSKYKAKDLDSLLKNIDTIDLFFNNISSLEFNEIHALLKEHPSWKKKMNILLPALLKWGPQRDIHLAEFLLENNYVDVNYKDSEGNTLLTNACKKDDKDTVSFLVEHGADVNVKNKKGETPLMWFVIERPCSPDIIDILIKYGVKINEQDNDGYTALHYACLHECNTSIILRLIRNGADENIKNNYDMIQMDY